MTNRVFIIGTGISGVAPGVLLRQRGWEITFVDHQAPASAASYGNAGSISGEAGLPEVAPEVFRKVLRWLTEKDGFIKLRAGYLPAMIPWLYQYQKLRHPRHVAHISRALIDIVDHANQVLWPLTEATGVGDLVRRTGSLSVYGTEEDMRNEYDSLEGYRQRYGRVQNFEMVTGEDLQRLEPDLPTYATHGLFFEGDGTVVNPADLVRRWYGLARGNGGAHISDRVVGFDVADRTISALVTASGNRIQTGGAPVLIAAGTWSHELTRHLGHRVPLRASRGYHLSFKNTGRSFGRTVLFDGHGFIMTDMQDGLRFAGTVEFQRPDAPPSPDRIENLRRRVSRFFPELATQDHATWMGCRPTLPDSLPVVSGSDRVRNAFFNFGHGSLGMAQSAGAGNLIADLITETPLGLDPVPYRIDRFNFP